MSTYENAMNLQVVEAIVETTANSKQNYSRDRSVQNDRQKDLNVAGQGLMTEAEKRMRREIANSNERRRMQSINAGFQSLRSLLPHHEGEKLSKASILQQTAEYIYQLEQEKTRLLSQNCQLKRLLSQHENGELPHKKRKTDGLKQEPDDGGVAADSVNETLIPDLQMNTMIYDAKTVGYTTIKSQLHEESALKRELAEVRSQLEEERHIRAVLEDQINESQMQLIYPSGTTTTTTYTTDEDGVVLSLVQNDDSIQELQVMDMCDTMVVPPVAQTQTVVTSESPVLQMESSSRPESPILVTNECIRLPKTLEDVMSSEPKVKVEEICVDSSVIRDEMISCTVTPSPPIQGPNQTTHVANARLFLGNTSRQNLEAIVEAIRHVEGDHLFAEDSNNRVLKREVRVSGNSSQEMPLALTTKQIGDGTVHTVQAIQTVQNVQTELKPYIHFHREVVGELSGAEIDLNQQSSSSFTVHQQPERPGVIVVKQNS